MHCWLNNAVAYPWHCGSYKGLLWQGLAEKVKVNSDCATLNSGPYLPLQLALSLPCASMFTSEKYDWGKNGSGKVSEPEWVVQLWEYP